MPQTNPLLRFGDWIAVAIFIGIVTCFTQARPGAQPAPLATEPPVITPAINGVLAFNDGFVSRTNLPPGGWEFFQVDVPADAWGWDVRLLNVTGGRPRLAVRRDQLPEIVPASAGEQHPNAAHSWPSGLEWSSQLDWTGDRYSPSGDDEFGRVLSMGVLNPLEPGIYYVGVLNQSDSDSANYTLQSRGIGPMQTIPIRGLEFSKGSTNQPGLLAREADYYQVLIPTNTPSWRLKISIPAMGDALLLVEAGVLPNVLTGEYPSQGWKTQKRGDEYFLLLPEAGQTNLADGPYNLAVISEGVNSDSTNGIIGRDSAGYVIESLGSLPINNLGAVHPSGETNLTVKDSLKGGELKAYRFTVPAGTLALEVQLTDRTGSPFMALRSGEELPIPADAYGVGGGTEAQFSSLDALTVPNPIAGTYSLTVQATAGEDGSFPDASYTVQVRALSAAALLFDGEATMAKQAANTWSFYTVQAPANAVGWDLRLLNISDSQVEMIVSFDELPEFSNLDDPRHSFSPRTIAPGQALHGGMDWTADDKTADGSDALDKTLLMGMGHPLLPGTYYVGVFSPASAAAYTLRSRGIGDGFTLPVNRLDFSGEGATAANSKLLPREAAYYRVDVPPEATSWRVQLTANEGESLLIAQQGALPNSAAEDGPATLLNGGKKMQKAGNEHYLLLPNPGEPNLAAGPYYLAVVSEGMNPHEGQIGTNASGHILRSLGSLPIVSLGKIGPIDGPELIQSGALEGGEAKAYQFAVAPGTEIIEVRLDDRKGNPEMVLRAGLGLPSPCCSVLGSYDPYGNDGGLPPDFSDLKLITVGNPQPGIYSLMVKARPDAGLYPDAAYTVRVNSRSGAALNFGEVTEGNPNSIAGFLKDGQSAFYKIVVPASFNGQPLLGWKLELGSTRGDATMRVRKNLLPADDASGTARFTGTTAILAPPFLTPGEWNVEVRGLGATEFTLTSGPLTLERPAWNMPSAGQPVTTAGLPSAGSVFADTGVDVSGEPFPGDQGVDLARDTFHYYAATIPTNNAGLLRAQLDALGGNPHLYVRREAVPVLDHGEDGANGMLFDRALTDDKFGNWVPADGRYESSLSPGLWYFAVHAANDSKARYRLRLSTGIITDLELNSGSFSNQTLEAGDWRYFRVQIPADAPLAWNVRFREESGDVVLYLRDTTPPGQALAGAFDIADWSSDAKNDGPYSSFDEPGSYTLTTPPLRPGQVYYLGFRARSDASFSVSSSANGSIGEWPEIDFNGGGVTNTISGLRSLRYRIVVPDGATDWVHSSVQPPGVELYISQGSPPAGTYSDAFFNLTGDSAFHQNLGEPRGWPWVGNQTFYLVATNTTLMPQTFSFQMDDHDDIALDSDGDGLPDNWEIQIFGNLAQTALDDPDGDGQNNLAEYLSGTKPTDADSRLLILPPTEFSTNTVRLDWQSVPGKRYRLQYQDQLDDPSWTDLGDPVTASGPSASATDDTIGSVLSRYYRVIVMPDAARPSSLAGRSPAKSPVIQFLSQYLRPMAKSLVKRPVDAPKDKTPLTPISPGFGGLVSPILIKFVNRPRPRPWLFGDTPGTIPGTFDVSLSGSASYTIPIGVPPGVADLQPNLSLVYNSGGGNGLLGMGFSLGGLPAITRGRREIEPDGFKGALNYDQDDRFFLDGQRLIATGPGGYMAATQQYRTELETFSRVMRSTGSPAIGSPTYFEVRTRDGLTLRFGSTQDSRIQVADMNPPVTSAPPEVRVWALNRITDRYGNSILIEYDEVPFDPLPTGSYRPKKIVYGQNSVEFNYELRTDTVPQTLGGYLVLETKRLKQIKTYADNQLVHSYALSYAYGTPTGRSQLTSLSLSGQSGAYPSTVFTWQNGGTVVFTQPQPVQSIVLNPQNQNQSAIDFLGTHFSLSGFNVHGPAQGSSCDVNGDGRNDIIVYEKTDLKTVVHVLLSTGTGLTQTAAPDYLGAPGSKECVYLIGDVNGDGKTDFIRVGQNKAVVFFTDPYAVGSNSRFNDGYQSTVGVPYAGQYYTDPQGYPQNNGNAQYQVGDVNGDGRSDLIAFYYAANQGGVFAAAFPSTAVGLGGSFTDTQNPNWVKVADQTGNINPNGDFAGQVVFLDANGDSKTDIAALRSGKIKVSFYDEAQHKFVQSSDETVLPGAPYGNRDRLIPADVNGDGNTDLLYVYRNGSFSTSATKVVVLLSDGRSKFVSQQSTYQIAATSFDGNAYQSGDTIIPGDFDGDRMMDLLFIPSAQSSANFAFHRGSVDSNGKVGFQTMPVSGIPGLGSRIEIGDFNGDGKADIFQLIDVLSYSDIHANFAFSVSGRLHASSGPVSDLVSKIEDGLGAKHNITYRSLTSSVYSKVAPPIWPTFPPSSGASPIRDYRDSRPMVQSYTVSDGIGGDRAFSYLYEDAKLHMAGRGFQGFHKVHESNHLVSSLTGKRIELNRTLEQSFPFTGRVLETKRVFRASSTSTSFNTLNVSDATWASAPNTSYGNTVYRVRPASREDKTYDFGSGSIVADTTTTYLYDAYDNPLVVSQSTIEGHTSVNSSTYNNNVGSWLIGQKTASIVNNIVPGSSLTRDSTYTYNAQGKLIGEIMEPSGALNVRFEHLYYYDLFGNHIGTREGNSQIAFPRLALITPYDSLGRFPIMRRNALNQDVLLTFDRRFGKISKEIDPNGITITTGYDGMGRVVNVTTPEGATTYDYEFDNYSDPAIFPTLAAYSVFKTAPNAPTVEMFHDIFGRAIRTRMLGFDLTRYIHRDTQYDARGRVLQRSRGYYAQSNDPALWTLFDYDDLDRITKEARPDNSITLFQYDLLGGPRVTEINALNQPMSTTRNSLGQIVSTKDALNRVTSFDYDAFGELTQLTEPGNVITTMTYDSRGRRTSVQEPNAGTWQFHYDVFGNLDQMTDAKLQVFSMQYDVLNRLVQRTDPGQVVGAWTYDIGPGAIGKLTHIQGPNGFSRSFAYDSLSRLIKEERIIDVNGYDSNPGNDIPAVYSTLYAYKQNSPLIEKLTYPAFGASVPFQTTNTYNSAGYPLKSIGLVGGFGGAASVLWEAKMMDAQGSLVQVALNDAKILANYLFNDGISTVNRQGTLRRIQITDVQANNYIFWENYLYNPFGSLQHKATLSGAIAQENYSYDQIDRISQVSSQQGQNSILVNYAYDTRGNISTKSDVGSYGYGSPTLRPHAVAFTTAPSGAVQTYSYDANGNMLSGNGRTLTYASFNKPEQIIHAILNSSSTLRYDPERNLVVESTQIGGSPATRVLGGPDYETVTDAQNNVVENHYLHAGNRLVGIYRRSGNAPDQTLYLHQDRLGSVQVITDESNVNLERLSYDASGKRRPYNLSPAPPVLASTSTDRGFTGHFHEDQVGLINMHARVYDPSNGSFLTVDPLRLFMPERTQAYAYAQQNPIRFTDPTGLQSKKDKDKDGHLLPVVEVFTESKETRWKREVAERSEFRRSQLPTLADLAGQKNPVNEVKANPVLQAQLEELALYARAIPDYNPAAGPTAFLRPARLVTPHRQRRMNLEERAANGDELAQNMLFNADNPWWVILFASPETPGSRSIFWVLNSFYPSGQNGNPGLQNSIPRVKSVSNIKYEQR